MPQIRHSLLFSLLGVVSLALLSGGCGQVITRPAPTVSLPTPTATATRALPTATLPATLTPVPATPEPTLTPTPEPTPILHTLQAGDTLIGLAGAYGVTVQAIQEANGITDPRGLQVGQQIIIPTDPESRLDAGQPTPEPTPVPMTISPLSFWEQPDALWALGQVTLPGPEAQEGVVVQVDLLDSDGAIIASDSVPIQNDVLLPGESAAFGLHFSPRPGPFSSYNSRIVSAHPAHLPFYRTDLVIQNVTLQTDDPSLAILSGEVSNSGADPAQQVHVNVILYDDAGRVIALRRVMTNPPDLASGETAFFAAELIPIHLPVTDYALTAEGRRPADD